MRHIRTLEGVSLLVFQSRAVHQTNAYAGTPAFSSQSRVLYFFGASDMEALPP